MRAYREYNFFPEKKCGLSQFEIAERLMRECGLHYENAAFWAEIGIHEWKIYNEVHTNRNRNAATAICRSMPQFTPLLKKFLNHDGCEDWIISNYDSGRYIPSGVTYEMMTRALPKVRARFDNAEVTFMGVDFFGRMTEPMTHAYLYDVGADRPPRFGSLEQKPLHRGGEIGINGWQVRISMDVTGDDGGIKDCGQYVEALNAITQSKSVYCLTDVMLDDAEMRRHSELKEKLADAMDAARKAAAAGGGALSDYPYDKNEYLMDNAYSLARLLKKLPPQYGYSYDSYRDFSYILNKRTPRGNLLSVDISTAPNCRRIEGCIKLYSPLLKMDFSMPQYTPHDQKEANAYMEKFMQYVSDIEREYILPLDTRLPSAPDWYFGLMRENDTLIQMPQRA